VAVELHETGLAMQRANLRRRNPDASDEEVDALMRAWLLERPLDCPST
jgi:Xaa-Pro aminopeptidase